MSFFNKAKEKLKEATRGFGEETIRVVEEEAPTKQSPQNSRPQRDTEDHSTDEFNENSGVDDFVANDEDSGFFVEDDGSDYFVKQEEAHQELLNSYGDIPVPKVREGRVEDVLSLLRIPATFEIGQDVLLPEDFKGIDFSIQMPSGYEIGEVNAFVAQMLHTVEKYVELLKLRNKHIAELATTVDRLQVDANNLKFSTEIANGINVMPTDDNESLENENMELRLAIRRLEDKVRSLENGTEQGLSNKERQAYERLTDRFSLLQREQSELKEENFNLINRLAVFEDSELDIGAGDSLPTGFSDQIVSSDFHIDDDDDDELPDFDSADFNPFESSTGIPQPQSGSSFAVDNEGSLDQFLNDNIEIYENAGVEESGNFTEPSYIQYDDDEDELDAIFNEGRNI